MADTYNNIDITSIYDISKQIVDTYRDNLIKAKYDPSGRLVNFTWNVEFNGEMYKLTFILPPEWKWAENGRGPGPVSIEGQKSILEWVKNSIRIGKLVPRGSLNELPEDKRNKSLAFLISRKIKRYGYKGKPVLKYTMQQNEDLIVKLCDTITNMLQKQVNVDLRASFSDLTSIKLK